MLLTAFPKSSNHVFDRGWPMPARTLPTISPSPNRQLAQLPGNCFPWVWRPLSCRKKLWVVDVLEVVRRDPQLRGRSGVFLGQPGSEIQGALVGAGGWS